MRWSIEELRSMVRERRRSLHARRFYRRFMSYGDLCFDVGANVGNRTSVFLELGARVIAVEPLEECQRTLTSAFGDHPRFALVGMAVGPQAGMREIQSPPGLATLASMSPEWVQRVRASGRFAEFHWTSSSEVEVTTLDALVEQYGIPAFCKIDVEGYELEVLQGLSQPLPTVSLEFVPERLEATDDALSRLESLAEYEYNYSLNETLVLASGAWLDRAALRSALMAYAGNASVFGDVYARKRAV